MCCALDHNVDAPAADDEEGYCMSPTFLNCDSHIAEKRQQQQQLENEQQPQLESEQKPQQEGEQQL